MLSRNSAFDDALQMTVFLVPERLVFRGARFSCLLVVVPWIREQLADFRQRSLANAIFTVDEEIDVAMDEPVPEYPFLLAESIQTLGVLTVQGDVYSAFADEEACGCG